MSKTAEPIELNDSPDALDNPQTDARLSGLGQVLRKTLTLLASLRLTVCLFALAVLLVFFGTLAQVDEGILTVLHNYFRTWWAWIPFQVFVRFGQVFLNFPKTMSVPGSFPFFGGWLIGGLLLTNLLAAHAIRFQLTWRRSGILLLHSGLVVMMVSEFVTGMLAVEGQMPIQQGSSSNFLQNVNVPELVIIDPSDRKADDVIAIPASLLRKGGLIQHPELPFDVEVVHYMVNSALRPVQASSENKAAAGDGLRLMAIQRPEASGTSSEESDMPSAYVTFKKKDTGESLGTYLVSLWYPVYLLQGEPQILLRFGYWPQQVACDGKKYDVLLRYQRTYKPYTIYLKEFRHDRYLGTDTPRNYSSDIRLVDPTRNEDRDVHIAMNEPLRYLGETFYQSSFLPGDQGTVLQVVRNPGWLMPYISCAMVSLGMLVHFGMHLVSFLRRRAMA
jgi:hypothetical protein